MAFDESNVNRDERGRFSSGGGDGGAVTSKGLSAFANRQLGSNPQKSLASLGASKRVWSDKVPTGMQDETWKMHYDAHPDKGGKASPERVKSVHEPIIKAALNVPLPAKGEQKLAIMTMGAPASGKSSMLKGVDTSKYVKVDPDAIKEQLPEYQKATSDPSNTYRGAAAMAHEESSHIAKQVMKEAVEKGHHIIVDGTGADKGKFLAKMEALKAAGYHVHVAMPHLDVEKGMARMADRAEKNGRYVPDDFVRKAYQDIPKNFSEIAKKADSAALFDASPTVAQGGARLVYEKHTGGHETHHDKQFVSAFRALHG